MLTSPASDTLSISDQNITSIDGITTKCQLKVRKHSYLEIGIRLDAANGSGQKTKPMRNPKAGAKAVAALED